MKNSEKNLLNYLTEPEDPCHNPWLTDLGVFEPVVVIILAVLAIIVFII